MKTLLISLITISSLSYAAVPGEDLFNYFAANCEQGDNTRQALEDAKALVDNLENLKNDAECKNLAGSVTQLINLQVQMQDVNSLNATQTQIAEYNSKEQMLLIQLTQTVDPAVISAINSQLRTLQVERSGLMGRESAKKELGGTDKTQKMANVIQAAEASLKQLAGNQNCLAKNQNIIKSATSIMSTIGSAASLVNPALGLGLTAGSALIGTTVQGIRDANLSKQIRKHSDQTVYFQGYKCALQALSNHWCQMKDAESFITFRENQNLSNLENDLGRALSLHDKEIPELIRWLDIIRSGAEPATTADASRQNQIITREAIVLAFTGNGTGYLNTQIKNPPLNFDWAYFRTVLRVLTMDEYSGNSNMANPMFEIYPSSFAPWYLLGYNSNSPEIKNPQNQSGYHTLESFEPPIAMNLIDIKNRYLDWAKLAKQKVARERSQVLQPDALAIITMARDKTESKFKISALDAMKSLIAFLEKHPPRESDAAFRKIYTNTLFKLKLVNEKVLTTLSAASEVPTSNTPNTTVTNGRRETREVREARERQEARERVAARERKEEDNFKQVVADIFETAQLQFGSIIFQSRLELMVRVALLEMMETSPPADQTVVAQILAAERFTDALVKSRGKTTVEIKRDINDAKPMTIANLETFVSFFDKNINNLLEVLYKAEAAATKAGRTTVAAGKRFQRTQLCHYLLAAPDVKKIEVKYCVGLKMEAETTGGPESQVITQNTFNQDFGKRACTIREFYRKSSIYSVWNIR